MKNPDSALRQTMAELLACTISELFPRTQLIETAASGVLFFSDVALPEVLQTKDIIPIIDEHLRLKLKQKSHFRIFEMVKDNAMAFLKHHRQEIKAASLSKTQDPLIKLIQIDESFVDLCPSAFLEELPDKISFKILEITPVKSYLPTGKLIKNAFRITGAAFLEQNELKDFIKQYKEASKHNHLVLGQKLELFHYSDHLLWLPKGIALKKSLIDFAHSLIPSAHPVQFPALLQSKPYANSVTAEINSQQYIVGPENPMAHFIPLFQPGQSYYASLVRSTPIPQALINGLLNSIFYESLLFFSVSNNSKVFNALISGLQFIERIINILGLQHRWCLRAKRPRHSSKESWEQALSFLEKALRECHIQYDREDLDEALYGPKADVQLFDRLGRQWCVSSIALEPHKQAEQALWLVRIAPYESLERWVALLIERFEGQLPVHVHGV